MFRSRERSRSPSIRDGGADDQWLADVFADDECTDVTASATEFVTSRITSSIHADVGGPVSLGAVATSPLSTVPANEAAVCKPTAMLELVESRAWPIVPQLVDQVAISELHGVAFEFLGSQEWPIVNGGHLPFLRAPPGTILWLAWGGHEYRIVVGETVWSQYC
jgi:hypothetical protein